LLPDRRQGVFPGKNGEYAKDSAVQQHLPQFEIDPVPEEEAFKCTEERDEWEYVR
jgi:hypothetical protein